MQVRRAYPFDQIEARWQRHWLEHRTFRAANPGEPGSDRPKYYILDMFPYPSGAGLHVGHPEGYTATDILARYRRMRGFNVLHPMGWDAFGLPAEQYAIKTGQHPRVTTAQNIATFRRQIQSLGFSYDWDREVDTTDPRYFHWTQWIFLQLYGSWFNPATRRAEPIATYTGSDPDSVRLAYVAEAPVNWCPELGTVLANEEVIDGKSEVGGFPVVRKPMRQWMLRITAYAQRLLDDLDPLDWSEALKEMQRNWIGRSDGAEVDFAVDGHDATIRVFTTRPDTLFGATYMVLAPEHRLVDTITTGAQREAVNQYREAAARKSDLERTELAKEKSGVWTGAMAVNPVNGSRIPVWIADYVLATYGTGAIMAVPAHDTRDFEFATKFDLPILQVVAPKNGSTSAQPVPPPESQPGSTGVPPVPLHTPTPYLDRSTLPQVTKHNLPHWEQSARLYFVTWRLADSLPQELRDQWQRERDAWLALHPEPWDAAAEAEYHGRFSDRLNEWLDAGHGTCVLRDPAVRSIVSEALLHFNGDRYELDAFVVMPNHVHALVQPSPDHSLASILHSWKSYTAHRINEALHRSGPLWQDESFDRIVRSPEHHRVLRKYVEENPDRAGLQDAAYSLWQRDTGGTPVLPAHATTLPFTDEGIACNSPLIDGLPTPEAKHKITAWLEDQGLGKRTVNFKLRDWLFSRQRYWGEPFPLAWKEGRHHALPESVLPVVPPDLTDFKPTGEGEPPLARAADWVRLPDGSTRETNTMPQWAGSCWYYLRYLDPANGSAFCDPAVERYWMGGPDSFAGVDLYVGGAEHAVLHLLYSRFWHKVLFDLGHVSTPEPFKRLVNQGIILGEDGQKMSKSRGNVINPDDVVGEHGADAFRCYEMFMGPLEQSKPWSMQGIKGIANWLARVWRLLVQHDEDAGTWTLAPCVRDVPLTGDALPRIHRTIAKVTDDLDGMRFNTAISALMVWVNDAMKAVAAGQPIARAEAESFTLLLAPFAPHLAEEIWSLLGHTESLARAPWPQADPAHLQSDTVEIVIQMNGKVRRKLIVPAQLVDKAAFESHVLAAPEVVELLAGQAPRKVIAVPGKLLNLVL